MEQGTAIAGEEALTRLGDLANEANCRFIF
jgi:hypothetical protein